MRAIVQSGYGAPEDVLALQEIGVSQALRLMASGLRKPQQRVPGANLAGFVVTTGAGVSRCQPGDAVLGESITRHQ